MTPIDFHYLATLTATKTPLECVEGKLTALYPPKEYASGKRVGEKYQNGEITSGGLKIFLKIDSPDLVLDTKMKGKTIRIEAKQGGKGISGIYYEVGEYPPGTEKREIRLTATASISFPGEAPTNASGTIATPYPVTTPERTQDAPQRPLVQQKGMSGGSGLSPVSVRVGNLLRIAKEVCVQTGQSYERFLDGLTPKDILNAATGTGLSYKEGYVHHDPYFGETGAGTQDDGGPPWEPMEKEQAVTKPKVPTWESCIHPKSGITLGAMPLEKLQGQAQWAYTSSFGDDPKDREAKIYQGNVLMAAEARGLTPKKIFMYLFITQEGCGDTFTLDDLEAVLGDQFSKASKNLTAEEWIESLKHLKKILEKCRSVHLENASGDDGTQIPD